MRAIRVAEIDGNGLSATRATTITPPPSGRRPRRGRWGLSGADLAYRLQRDRLATQRYQHCNSFPLGPIEISAKPRGSPPHGCQGPKSVGKGSEGGIRAERTFHPLAIGLQGGNIRRPRSALMLGNAQLSLEPGEVFLGSCVSIRLFADGMHHNTEQR